MFIRLQIENTTQCLNAIGIQP